jgi:hypothetical protein
LSISLVKHPDLHGEAICELNNIPEASPDRTFAIGMRVCGIGQSSGNGTSLPWRLACNTNPSGSSSISIREWSATRLAKSPEGELQFEEAAEPAIQRLGLDRDGVVPIEFANDHE